MATVIFMIAWVLYAMAYQVHQNMFAVGMAILWLAFITEINGK